MRAHHTASWAVVRTAAPTLKEAGALESLSKGGAQSGQHLRDWTAKMRTSREPGQEPVLLIQGRHGGGRPG